MRGDAADERMGEAALANGMRAYLSMVTDYGDALLRQASRSMLSRIDAVIFDVDGVLIDVSRSIRLVHGLAASLYFESIGWSNCEGLVRAEDVDEFKLAGGFNSDWELAYSWLLFYLFQSKRCGSTDGYKLMECAPSLREFATGLSGYGGGLGSAVRAVKDICPQSEWEGLLGRWDKAGVQRVFVEVYSGELCPEIYGFEPELVRGPGLIREDRPILCRRALPSTVRLGIATGRTAGETKVGLRLSGWEDLFEPHCVVTEDDGFRKPDPRILELAVQRLGAQHPVYVGDSPDDLATVQRYSEGCGQMLSCMVLTGSGGTKAKQRFQEQEADIIADNVNAGLAAIADLIGGAR